jgi:hypothetical protein
MALAATWQVEGAERVEAGKSRRAIALAVLITNLCLLAAPAVVGALVIAGVLA